MQKEVLLVFLLLLLVPVSSASINDELQKITNYAEDFEAGNINYAQLVLYSSASKERINEELGSSSEFGGIVKQEQLEPILGKPSEQTKWIWVEDDMQEKKLDSPLPVWRKNIFDGNKIKLTLEAYPSLIKINEKESVFYRLNVNMNFKKPEEQLNLESRISEVTQLAEIYNKDPSSGNAEALAEKSVSIEKLFQTSMRDSSLKCENTMNEIFGSENKKEEQSVLVNEIDFYEGDDFSATANLQMCEDCQWSWINLDLWIESRNPASNKQVEFRKENLPANLEDSEYQDRIREIVSNIKLALDNKDFEKANSEKAKLFSINEAWNQKSNDVWKEADKLFQKTSDSEESRQDPYYWVKQEQLRRDKVQELINKNYDARKSFYLDLFKDYTKKEFFLAQIRYEKRLIEDFTKIGQEICNNNLDDNKNEQIDCQDSQCSGKICGKQKVTETTETNETKELEKDLYCIASVCQLREETIELQEIVCGNHICEENETLSCQSDCTQCPVFEAVNCSGKVIFSGTDENQCPLAPICIEENNTCQIDSDCLQPLCGTSSCIENQCQLNSLQECKEPECNDGEKEVINCENGKELVTKICENGLWTEVPNIVACQKNEKLPVNETEIPEQKEQEPENECNVKEDCGNPSDVCSNGKCVTLPSTIEEPEPEIEFEEISAEEIEKRKEQEEKESQEESKTKSSSETESQETSPEQSPSTENSPDTITAQVTKSFKLISDRITGFVISITGFETEETPSKPASEPSTDSTSSESSPESSEENTQTESQDDSKQENSDVVGSEPQNSPENNQQNENREERDYERENEDRRKDDEQRERKEQEKREEECKNMCKDNCEREVVVPCVDKCTREAQKFDDATIEQCKSSCKQENDVQPCITNCESKCKKGEDWWQEKKEEDMMQESAFMIGGECRSSEAQQKSEANIYFDGWGNSIWEDLRPLKQKYYSGGEADWCKDEFENIIKQRKEFEKSFNNELIIWFFEKYLPSSADEWQQHMSGLYELYWKDVEISKQMAYTSTCLNKEIPSDFNLINIEYETEFGKLKFWEELKPMKMNDNKEVMVVSPYMELWIFPPKEFILTEFKKAMKTHKFPGPSEEGSQGEEGPTQEEVAMIKQDKEFMEKITKITSKYNGNVDVSVQFKDYTTNEIIFNLYAKVNENEIFSVKPMLPEEMPEKDITITMDFEKLYELIYDMEKDMKSSQTQNPPWDNSMKPIQKVKEVTNGVQMYFKIRSMLNSAEISPIEVEDDANSLMKEFLSMMMKGDKQGPPEEESLKQVNENQEKK